MQLMITVCFFVLSLTHIHSIPSNSKSYNLVQAKLFLINIATPPPCRVLCFVNGRLNACNVYNDWLTVSSNLVSVKHKT